MNGCIIDEEKKMPTLYISLFCKGGTGNVGVEERSFNLAGLVLRAECQKSSVSEMRVENIRAAECGLLPTSSLLASTELSSSPASQQSKYQEESE